MFLEVLCESDTQQLRTHASTLPLSKLPLVTSVPGIKVLSFSISFLVCARRNAQVLCYVPQVVQPLSMTGGMYEVDEGTQKLSGMVLKRRFREPYCCLLPVAQIFESREVARAGLGSLHCALFDP